MAARPPGGEIGLGKGDGGAASLDTRRAADGVAAVAAPARGTEAGVAAARGCIALGVDRPRIESGRQTLGHAPAAVPADRKRAASGKGESVRVDLGGRRTIKNKKKTH